MVLEREQERRSCEPSSTCLRKHAYVCVLEKSLLVLNIVMRTIQSLEATGSLLGFALVDGGAVMDDGRRVISNGQGAET
eukprot:1136972-Pelagomonas_calceolata.AAC.9